MRVATVRAALRFLEKRGLVQRTNRPGQTSIFTIADAPVPDGPSDRIQGNAGKRLNSPPAPVPPQRSTEEWVALCKEVARQECLPNEFVASFIAHHSGEHGWRIDGQPIWDLPAVLRSWCESAGRSRTGRLEHSFSGAPSEIQLECYEIAHRLGLRALAVEKFIDHHERNQWMAPNPVTGCVEPIRDLQACLSSFCAKYEADLERADENYTDPEAAGRP